MIGWLPTRVSRATRHALAELPGKRDKAPAQFGETFLPLVLALLFGRADLGVDVSGGRRRGISGWLNSERTHHEHGEIVCTAHPAPDASADGRLERGLSCIAS